MIDKTVAQATQLQADAVTAAINSAGGPAVIAKAITDRLMLRDKYWESHPEYSAVDSSAVTVASIDAQLAKLGGDNASGTLADNLRAERLKATASFQDRSAAVDADLQKSIADIVAKAMAGDEPSRVAILGDALAEPRAFASGFADSLDAAAFLRSPDPSGRLSLVLSTGLPSDDEGADHADANDR